MFTLPNDVFLTTELLSQMIMKFYSTVVPKLQTYKDYYDGNQPILQKYYDDPTKPCNKIVTNYCQDITDAYCGYIASPGYISYNSEQDISDIMEILNYNDYQEEDSSFLLDALKVGVAAELMYIDNNAEVRFRTIDPLSCFGVYDNTLSGDLRYFVRIYQANEWDNSINYCVDVYDDKNITHYNMAGKNGQLTLLSQSRHYFSQVPANIFYLPDEKSVFDAIMGLQDAANIILSDEVDDYSAFCDAYFALIGIDPTDENIEQIALMKQNRTLVLPEGAAATWLTKNATDTQVENILKRIHDNIYRIAKCPDFSSETFVGGVSSGIAIRYRLTGMETKAAMIAAAMKKALQRRIEIICGVESLKLGEEVFRDIDISFTRNIPEDNTSIVNLVNALKGTVSDATLLAQIPFVKDVQAELAAISAQKKENMSLYLGGSLTQEDEDNE